MLEDDDQPDEIQAQIFLGPVWKDEDADEAEEEPLPVEAADDVEAHGGGGFNDAA